MAKVFKISAYIVDAMDEYDKFKLEDLLTYCTQNDVSLRHLKICSADIGEWDDDNPLNRLDCSVGEFAKHFRVCLDEKENA